MLPCICFNPKHLPKHTALSPTRTKRRAASGAPDCMHHFGASCRVAWRCRLCTACPHLLCPTPPHLATAPPRLASPRLASPRLASSRSLPIAPHHPSPHSHPSLSSVLLYATPTISVPLASPRPTLPLHPSSSLHLSLLLDGEKRGKEKSAERTRRLHRENMSKTHTKRQAFTKRCHETDSVLR